MSNRIDDRKRELEIEEIRKEQQRVISDKKQREFERALGVQTQGVPQTKKPETAAPLGKQIISQAKDPKNAAPAKKADEKPSETPKTERNKVSEKESKKETSQEKKMESLVYERAVTEKNKQDQSSDQESQGDGSEDFFQQAAIYGTITPPAEQSDIPAGTRISNADIQSIVGSIYSGINIKGLKELTIEFTEGVLGGGTLKVSSANGKIFLHFTGLDKNSQYLVKNARQELATRLSKQNLSLVDLEVS